MGERGDGDGEGGDGDVEVGDGDDGDGEEGERRGDGEGKSDVVMEEMEMVGEEKVMGETDIDREETEMGSKRE